MNDTVYSQIRSFTSLDILRRQQQGDIVTLMKPTHADKLLFEKDQITKGNLIDYYTEIAPTMLPHLHARPISMQRFPNGIQEDGFYQKEVPDYFPDYIHQALIPVLHDHTTQPQVLCENVKTLTYLADQATITIHAWLSTIDHLQKPDRLIFDLDPSDTNFKLVKDTALMFKKICDELKLCSYPMITGSKGIHVMVPIRPELVFDDVREIARQLCEHAAAQNPTQLTTEVSKEKREGRLFLDYLRNSYAQTSVTPYSVRAKPEAPVATPIHWDEVADLKHAHMYTMKTIFARLKHMQDPLADFAKHRKSIKHLHHS